MTYIVVFNGLKCPWRVVAARLVDGCAVVQPRLFLHRRGVLDSGCGRRGLEPRGQIIGTVGFGGNMWVTSGGTYDAAPI